MAHSTSRNLLKGFLGMLNYYRRFHPTSKTNMQHLESLTYPKVKFKWNQKANSSFNNTMEMLAHDELLVNLDFDKPFHLDADASKNKLGGIIYQEHEIISYHSRLLPKHQ